MNNIPQSRVILYILIAGLLPVFFVIFYFLEQKTDIEELDNYITRIENIAFVREKKQSLNLTVSDHFKDSDHFYVDKNLETLTFLEPEIEVIQKLVNNKYFAGNETVKKRLDFITGPGNSLLFSEGNVQSYPFFQETIATLVHPVEVNIEDIKEILALTEGEPINGFSPGPDRPQIIILDFKLDKKDVFEGNQVFLLNMKLLKREYL